MKLTKLGILVAAAAAIAIAAGGCEAIVSNSVPAYTCSMTPYSNPGTGSCPQGMFCEGAGCAACNPKGDDPCDGYDNDCDGVIDNGPKSDHDGDGYTYCGKIDPVTGKQTLVDCNDDDKTISPAGHEVCNGKDDNCDGIIDNANLVCPANETCVPTTGACISNAQTCNTTNCPAPKVCDPQTQQCVLPSSQDAGSTGCTSNEQCTTGICANPTELGPGQQPVCTQPCCTSADCAGGFVCYGAGTGGNYCIAATSINRAAPGRSVPGQACGGDTDCRSGVCTAGKCEDTCCSNTNCTNSTSCTVTSFGGNTTLACAPPPGTTATNSSCNSNSDCLSGFCQTYNFGETSICVPACCSSKQCGVYGTGPGATQLLCYDEYIPPATSGPVVPVCDYPQPGSGTSDVGETCVRDSDCFSNRCLAFSAGKMCSDACCVDTDCGKTGWVCRPTPDGPGTYLRCVPVGG